MSIDIINGVAAGPTWADKGLEERNEALTQAYDADRDSKDLRSDEQKELDRVNVESAEGFGSMLGQGGESAAEFTPSGFVAQDVLNQYADGQRNLAIGLNTAIYQKNNSDPAVRGNYQEMANAITDYMDGDQTAEDARMMGLRMSAETLNINKIADSEMEMEGLASEYVQNWSVVDDHTSPVTSFISGVTDAAQTGIAAGLSALDPDVRSGAEPAYDAESVEFRDNYKATRDKMLGMVQQSNPDLFGPDRERIVDTYIADAKLDAEKFEGKAILNSKGELITKSSFYLMHDSEQKSLLGGLGLSKHQMREYNETKDFMSERVMEKYREAASYIPLDFKAMGDGDLDQGIKNFVASDGMKGTLLKGAGKAGARLSDFMAGASRLVTADGLGEEYTKQAAAGRLMAGQMGGNELVSDVIGVAPDLYTSRLGGKAMMKLSKAGKAGKAAGATAEQIKAAQKVSVYGSAIGSGAGVGLGVFGESMSAGNSYAKSLLLAGEGMAITAGITTIGGVSGFEAMTAGALGAKSVVVKLRANTTFNEAMKLRWGQMNAFGKSAFNHSYKEYFEETGDEWLQSIAVSSQLYPHLTLQDHAEMAWHAGKVGAVIGGIVGSVSGVNQIKAFNAEFKDVRNQAKLSDIAKNRGIAKEVESTVNDLVEFGAPITAGALTDKVINDAKQQNDEREAKIEAETGKAGIAQRIITKLGDLAAGRKKTDLKDDVAGRQVVRIELSRDVAIKADEAYRDDPTPENQAKLSAANLNFDTQMRVGDRIAGGLTANNQAPGETSTSETVVEDEPGKAIPENQAVDEFNEVKPTPVNPRRVEEQRQADEERAAADAAADAAANNQGAEQPATPVQQPQAPNLPAQAANQPAPTAPVTPVAKPKRPYNMKQKPVVTPVTPVVETVGQIEARLKSNGYRLENLQQSKRREPENSKLYSDLKPGDRIYSARYSGDRGGEFAIESVNTDAKGNVIYTIQNEARGQPMVLPAAQVDGLVSIANSAKSQAAVDPVAATKVIFNTKRESYKTDDEYKSALTDGVGNLVRSIAPNIKVDVVIDDDDNASARYKPNINPETKEITGGTIRLGRNYKETLKKRYAHLKRKDGDEDFEIHTMRMAIDEEVRHHGALVSVGYKGLVDAGTNILADAGSVAVAKLYNKGALIKEDGADYSETEKIQIAAEVFNTLGQRIAHGHSTVDIVEALKLGTKNKTKGSNKLLKDFKRYLTNWVSTVTGKKNQPNVAPEIMEQVQRIEAFLKSDFGYGQDTQTKLKLPTKIQQNIDNNGGIVLDTAAGEVSNLNDSEIYDSLNRANEFVRATRQDGVKQTPGLYRFNESTMKLEIAADSTYDGYGEEKYGSRMPERAALQAGLDEFNKRNDVKKLNAKYEADVKYKKPIEQQEQSLKNLKRAVRANLRLAVTDPSNSDMLKNKMVPVRDDSGAKRSMMEIFDDKEAVNLAGQMEVKQEVGFLNNLGLSPNVGGSSRNSPRVNALMKFFNNRFTPDTAGRIRNQDKVTIKPNQDVLLDLLALRDALPSTDSTTFGSLFDSGRPELQRKYEDSPEGRKIITALVNNGWMKFGPDGKTGLIDTIPKKSQGRYNTEYRGLDRKDIGQSLMLLNGKQNKDGSLEIDLTAPAYLTESQQAAYDKTRASNVNYTLSTRTARGMLNAVNNGTFPRRVADRIKAADPAAPLYSGTDFEVDKSGHPYIRAIGGTFAQSSRPELKSENGDSKPIPMPESGITNVSDVNMDWLKATKTFFDVVAKHAKDTKMSPSLHPTITYAKPISDAIAGVQKMVTNQINQYKRSADYKEGAPIPFATDDIKQALVKQYGNVLFRVRDLNDMITETAKQVTRNSTLQQDSYVDYDMLNEMESYGQFKIENISARQLVDVLDRQFSNEKLYTESLMADGTGRAGFENQEDVLKNDNIIALIREFGLNKSKSTQEQNKRMRSLMLVVLNDGDIDAARAFSGEYKTEESLDEALMDRLAERVEEEAVDVNTDKRLILKQVMGDTDETATKVAAGKSDKEGFEYIKSFVEQLPTNKVEVMKAKDGLASFAPGLTGGRVTPTDILIQQIGGNLDDVSMIYYDGKGIDRKKAANGSLVLLDADNNITGILVDSSDTMFDDGIAKVADQILQQTLAKNIDTKVSVELDDFKSVIDEVLARPGNTDAYEVVKKQVGQSLSDLSNAEFVQKVMRDTRLQQALGDLKLDQEADLAVPTDAELESLTTSYLDAAFYMAPTEQDANPVAEYEHSDLDPLDTSRPDLASFGQAKMEQAFDGLDLDPLLNYKNSDVLRQVVKAGLGALKPTTSTTQVGLAEQYQLARQKERAQVSNKDTILVTDFLNKKNSLDRRFDQYEKSLDTPFRANNLNVKPDTDTSQRRKDATTLDEKWAAAFGDGNYVTKTPLDDVDFAAGQKVRDSYEKTILPGLPSWVASLELDDVYKEATLDHYVKRMAAQRSQLRKQRESGQKVNTPLTSYDLRDGTVGVAKLKEMMKESGASLDLTKQGEETSDFDALWEATMENVMGREAEITPGQIKRKGDKKPRIFVFDTAPVAGEEVFTPPVKMKPVSALSAPGATVSVVKAANKLQLDVRNKMYQSDALYRNLLDKDPNGSFLQNYNGLIASMAQTYADPRTTASTKAAAATVLQMAIKGKHQPVSIMGHKIMANTISEDAAKTMLAGVYSKFRKRVWNHRASVVDTVLSQDKTANDYGHDIFARVDLGLRGTDGRNGYLRETHDLKQVLQPLEAKMGKKKATEAYVSSLIGSISNDKKANPFAQVQHNIQELKAGMAFNQAFLNSLSIGRQRGKVAAEIRAQIAPAMKAIKKAESLMKEEGFNIQAFDAAMLDGLSTSQKMFIQNAREYFAKKLPALQLMSKMNGEKKRMGTYENYLPWRTFDVDNPQGPDVGFNDLEPEQTLESHSNYLGKRFSGDQANGIDLNPLRAILAVANTTAYQTNTKFSNEHFANVFGDDSHESQFKKAVKHYDEGGQHLAKLNLLNEVMAEEIRTTINNDLRATKHDNWFFRGTDLAAATGFRVSLTSIEQPFLQTLPVLGAYGARDPGKAAKVSEVLTKLVATTPMKAANKLTGGEANTYADYVDTLIRYAAPELHAREVNGINEMKDVIDKVRLSDLEGIIDKVTFAPKSLYSIINTTHDWFLKASTGAPDSMLIRAIWAANYEHATGQKIGKDSLANFNVTAAFNATRTAEGEMALSDGSTKSQLFQQAENGGIEFFRRSLIVFSNHLMSLAPNVSAAKAMLKSDDPAMKAEGKKRIGDFVLQTVLFNGLKMKNLAFAVAYMTTRGIDDEDERHDAFMKRQEKLLGFAHDYAGFKERRPLELSDYAWSMGVKSAIELTGVATPWASIAAINGTANSMVKEVAKAVFSEQAPGTGDRYMKEIEGFVNMFGAPGFGLNAILQYDAVHRTATKDYEFNMKHLALMYLSFGGPREMRQRMMNEVRENTGAPEWNKSYGRKIDMPLYDHTPSNFKSHDAPLAPTDFKYEKPTADEWAMAEFTPPKSYKLERMDWLNREGASYIDGDSGVMKDGFLSYFYPRMLGVDTLESNDNNAAINSSLLNQAASLEISKQQALDFGRKAAHDTYMNLKDQDVYVSHNEEKVHGGRRTWAHILIKKGDKFYNVGSLSLIKGYALPLGRSNARDKKLNDYAKRNKRGFYADKAK